GWSCIALTLPRGQLATGRGPAARERSRAPQRAPGHTPRPPLGRARALEDPAKPVERLGALRVEARSQLELAGCVGRALQALVEEPEREVRRGRRRVAGGGAFLAEPPAVRPPRHG